MRELRAKSRNEVEVHIDNPKESLIFRLSKRAEKGRPHQFHLATIAVSVGNVRSFYEIEALMDEEIRTIARDKLKPYQAMATISEALPSRFGIVAADSKRHQGHGRARPVAGE